jgi:SPP1 family predicted phage head-tail adaptor
MLQAGRLRERVEIQRATLTRDAHGEAVPSWDTSAEVFAAVKPAGGKERDQQDATRARRGYELTVRAGVSLLPTDRLLWRGVAYDVEAITDDPSREFKVALIVESPDAKVDVEGQPALPVGGPL